MKLPEDPWEEASWLIVEKDLIGLGIYIRWLSDYAYHEGRGEMNEVNPSILFGVVMKSLTGIVTPDNVLEVADRVWGWANSKLEEPEEQPEEPKRTGMISEKQHGRFWAIAKRNSFTNDGAHRLLASFGIESSRDIPWQQYERVINALQQGEAQRWNQKEVVNG